MDKKTLEINSAVEIAKKNYKQGDLVNANEIYKNLINKKIYTYDLLLSYGVFNMAIKNNLLAKKLLASKSFYRLCVCKGNIKIHTLRKIWKIT